ncbi:MAG: enoyl-CoA hydratase-related protein [Desulfurococcales archaeon]|nr:enoyl-CoA hydratase-related protein [Desulfurococcales archaeon]
MNDLVRLEETDTRIVKLVLNRPEAMNAINVPMRKQLAVELERLAYDDNIRVVIITGAEKEGRRKAFSSGDDLKDPGFKMESPTAVLDYYKVTDEMMRLYDFIDNYPKPVIAMVNGIALGGGVELALSCDFIFAGENAVFGFPEVNLGFIPGWGGTQRLTRRVGEANAKRLIFTGETITAREAKDISLVDVVTAEEDLWNTTLEFARRITGKSPLMITAAKKSIERGMECSMQSGLLYEMLGMMMSLKTEDMKEGITAFLEKRKPIFTGK